MKKMTLFAGIIFSVLVFYNCSSSKKVAAVPKLTYTNNIQPLVLANCSPCHIPAKGGNKKPYDNYANVKTDIDEIVRRIQLNPGDKGYMPFKRPKLSDSTIMVFKQ